MRVRADSSLDDAECGFLWQRYEREAACIAKSNHVPHGRYGAPNFTLHLFRIHTFKDVVVGESIVGPVSTCSEVAAARFRSPETRQETKVTEAEFPLPRLVCYEARMDVGDPLGAFLQYICSLGIGIRRVFGWPDGAEVGKFKLGVVHWSGVIHA